MDIQPGTKLFEVFAEHPEMEKQVMEMAPVYRNLQNPVLRRTVGRLATLEKVAMIGKLEVTTFVNALRKSAGQPPLTGDEQPEAPALPTSAPDWLKGTPERVIDGTAMLNGGEHPLGLVTQLMQDLPAGKHLLLQTNFPPLPLVEAMEKQGYRVFGIESAPGEHMTYIGKE